MLGIPATLPSRRGVLLTFDDGPHPQGTPAMLAALGRERVPAVFFVCGEQAVRYPELLREIVSAGHELGIHGFRHQTRRQWTGGLVGNDTRQALEAVWDAASVVPRLYRPAHGVFSSTGLRTIRRLGLEPLLWSRWGRDWQRGATSAAIARRATAGIRAGDVVLLHDADHYGARGSWRSTVAALGEILSRITAVGLEATSVGAAPGAHALELAA
jgi:peptidoglycan/xylan/chitin deacetylase (PgdA/CDA1 family)